MNKRTNPVAKHGRRINKAGPHRDRKRDAKAGKTKHKENYRRPE